MWNDPVGWWHFSAVAICEEDICVVGAAEMLSNKLISPDADGEVLSSGLRASHVLCRMLG